MDVGTWLNDIHKRKKFALLQSMPFQPTICIFPFDRAMLVEAVFLIPSPRFMKDTVREEGQQATCSFSTEELLTRNVSRRNDHCFIPECLG
jgi:hypothetical protein